MGAEDGWVVYGWVMDAGLWMLCFVDARCVDGARFLDALTTRDCGETERLVGPIAGFQSRYRYTELNLYFPSSNIKCPHLDDTIVTSTDDDLFILASSALICSSSPAHVVDLEDAVGIVDFG